jgi:hypothetical protein
MTHGVRFTFRRNSNQIVNPGSRGRRSLKRPLVPTPDVRAGDGHDSSASPPIFCRAGAHPAPSNNERTEGRQRDEDDRRKIGSLAHPSQQYQPLCRLLKTNLTELEREYVERRLSDEQLALETLVAFPVGVIDPEKDGCLTRGVSALVSQRR